MVDIVAKAAEHNGEILLVLSKDEANMLTCILASFSYGSRARALAKDIRSADVSYDLHYKVCQRYSNVQLGDLIIQDTRIAVK